MAWQAAIAPIVGGIIGNMVSSGDRGDGLAALQRGWAELDAIGMPPDLSQRVLMQQFQQAGILTPELEQDMYTLGDSKVAMIEEDSSLRDAQMDALSGLRERAKIGLSPEDRLAVNEIRRDSAVEAEAKRQQILQNFAARGQAGSGSEFIAALQAGQSGAEEASRQGDRIGAMASQNALQAISSAGSLGGQIRQQDFGVASAKAGAEDSFNLANWNAANQRQARNVGQQNQAQQYNLGQAQNISNANTSMENQERLRMENAKRDYWQDKMARASAYSGQGQQQYQASNDEADRTSNMWAGIGSGVGTGIAGYQQNQNTRTQNQLNRDNDLAIAKLKNS